MPSLITLTTDFGTTDHFVATMKGVILGIAPRARIVDISHEVRPFEVQEAAFLLAETSRYYPKKTIHVAVVDPGVGTARRPILVEAGGQYFVGPDNGIFGWIYSAMPHKIRELTNSKYFLKTVSQTFHARDIFAPVAAHLAAGVRPAQFGKLIRDYLRPTIDKPMRTGHRTWTGTILRIDRFGNLITNLRVDEFPAVLERPFILIPGVHQVMRLVKSYAEAPEGELAVIPGSSGYYEVCLNQQSAAKFTGVGVGSPVELAIY
jgi:S-adenosylmethionine hydrolase